MPQVGSPVPVPLRLQLSEKKVQLTQQRPRLFSSGTGNTWTHECQDPGVLGTNRNVFDRSDDGPRETTFSFQCLLVAVQCFKATA